MAVFTRSQRVATALLLAIVLSVGLVAILDESSVSAVKGGDFPAFYTMAIIVDKHDASRLYDATLQQSIQAAVWPGFLKDALLPAAYPPYVAALVRPLAWLEPTRGRFAWTVVSVLSFVLAGYLFVRLTPLLQARQLECFAAMLTFAPFLMGVFGGQTLAFSALVYVLLLRLLTEHPQGVAKELSLGAVIGLWLFKPQYALVALLPLLVRGRWNALLGAALVGGVLYLIGASAVGWGWPSAWLEFTQIFAEMNFVSNSHQMTNLYAVAWQLAGAGISGHSISWLKVCGAGLSIAIVVSWVGWSARLATSLRDAYLVLPPILSLATPQANFYDLGLSVFPLLLMAGSGPPRITGVLVSLWVAAAAASMFRSPGHFSWFFVVTIVTLLAIVFRVRHLNQEQSG